MAKQVFISYSSEDKNTADKIQGFLENEGIDCWIAPRDVIPGKPYGEEIIKGISAAEIMVVLLSVNANVSTFVKNEVERAISKKKTVIPFKIQDVPPSEALELFLAGSHWIEAWNPPLEAKIRLLATTIKNLLGLDTKASDKIPNIDPSIKKPITPPEPPTDTTLTEELKTIPSSSKTNDTNEKISKNEGLVVHSSNADVEEVVRKYLDEIKIQGGWQSYYIEDINSRRIFGRIQRDIGESAIPVLLNYLTNKEIKLRWRAMRLLTYFKFGDTKKLRAIWKNEIYLQVRKMILETIVYLSDDSAVSFLGEIAANDDSYEIRRDATEALVRHAQREHHADVMPVLLDALNDNHPYVRCVAIKGLVILRSEEVIGSCKDLLYEDKDNSVRGEASMALAELGPMETSSCVFDAFTKDLINDYVTINCISRYVSRFGRDVILSQAKNVSPKEKDDIIEKAILAS
jgi:hypothetical protein